MTKQYETEHEELSGGQWQTIALARTFFREAPFYILDEPTAVLDAEAEEGLFEKFEVLLYKTKGALLISHHLSNITAVDITLVIEDGVVIRWEYSKRQYYSYFSS